MGVDALLVEHSPILLHSLALIRVLCMNSKNAATTLRRVLKVSDCLVRRIEEQEREGRRKRVRRGE